MKRFVCLSIFCLLLVHSNAATVNMYVNNGIVSGSPAPVIDATNFVNNGIFTVVTLGLFDTSNTLNFTNRNAMNGSPGFRFDTATPSGRRMAANFHNANTLPNETNAVIAATQQIRASATNVVNRGYLAVPTDGFVRLEGKNVDTSRGTIVIDGFRPTDGIFDNNWGIGTNVMAITNHAATTAYSPTHEVESISGNQYVLSQQRLVLTNFTTLNTFFYQLQQTNRTVQLVYLRNVNTQIVTQVRSFGGSPTNTGIVFVEFSHIATNPLTGLRITNFLYLTDVFGSRRSNDFVIRENGFPPLPPVTAYPDNFTLSRAQPPLFLAATPPAGAFLPPPDPIAIPLVGQLGGYFWGTNLFPSAEYAAYSARITSTTFEPRFPQTRRTLPGRVELVAEQSLNLNLARIQGLNYTLIESTNHFVGGTNAAISTVFSDVRIGSSNGTLNATGLLQPIVPRITGTIDIYSAIWSNSFVYRVQDPLVATNFTTNTFSAPYHVLLIDANLSTTVSATVLDLSLRSDTNIFIGDTFNVVESLKLDAPHVTILPAGRVNLNSIAQLWNPTATPRMKSLTNFGGINAVGDIRFAALDSDGLEKPYGNFVNRGTISAGGVFASADNLFNFGTISTFPAAIILEGGNVVLSPNLTNTSPLLLALSADVHITANNLFVTNQAIRAGRTLNVSVSGSLNAGANTWSARDGFNLLVKPQTGDFTTVVVTNTAGAFADVVNWWAAEDRGPTFAGNNAEVGRLILNGAPNSRFTFLGTTDAQHALYVDRLDLTGTTTTNDIVVAPNMKIYYLQAWQGGVNISAALANVPGFAQGGGRASLFDALPNTPPLPTKDAVRDANYNLDVTVATSDEPGAPVTVSWNTVARAINYVYSKNSLSDADWDVVSFFESGDYSGRISINDETNPGGRVYKVRVDLANP